MKNIKTLSFSIQIETYRNTIWDVLWNPETYTEWTKIFSDGSHYKGDLKQGNKILFLGEDGGGMSSIVETLINHEKIVFAHQKEIKDGIEIESDWEGARETYLLKKETEGTSTLQVTMDATAEMEKYFTEIFPKALERIKQLSENKAT